MTFYGTPDAASSEPVQVIIPAMLLTTNSTTNLYFTVNPNAVFKIIQPARKIGSDIYTSLNDALTAAQAAIR